MILVLMIFLVGLCLSAFFSGSETGFYRVTRVRLALDALSGDPISKCLLWLANNPAMFVATTLVGNNMANYVTSLAIVLGTHKLIGSSFPLLDLIAPIVLSPLVFVYGELLPKSLYYSAPNRLLRAGGPLFLFCGLLFLPVSGLLWLLARALQWCLGESPEILQLELARNELLRVLDEGQEAGILRPAQRRLTQAIFHVADTPVVRYCIPASRMTTVPRTAARSDLLRAAQRFRSPVILVRGENQRDFVGYVQVSDLLLRGRDWRESMRPLPNLRDTDSHLTAVTQLQKERAALARITDAAGRIVGVVSTQRLLDLLLRANGPTRRT